MHVKATIKGKPLAGALIIPEREWRNLGNAFRTRIINRTRRQGVDADGRTFEGYSDGYKAAKAKRGGNASRVDLTGVRGGMRMLDNITVLSASATTNPRVTVGFAVADKDRIARYHMGEGRVDRLFFALSDEDLEFGVGYIRERMRSATP